MKPENGSKNAASANGQRYSFDEFEIDAGNRTCARAGEVVPLTGKVFDVLLTFVENPGRLLGKDELMGHVWPDEFVEEGNLARNVSTLRKALGDTGREHRFIATVQGRGYRFIADVVDGDEAVPLVSESISTDGLTVAKNGNNAIGSEVLPHAGRDTRNDESFIAQLVRRPWLLSIGAFCLIGTAVVAFRLDGERPRQIDKFSLQRLKETRLAQKGNSNGGGLISPDGQYLLYSRRNGNENGLWLRQMSTGSSLELRPLQTGESFWAAAFAPDNSYLYYILKEKDTDDGNIYNVPLLGGPQKKLTSHANGALTVSPDGQKLAFQRIDRDAGTDSIVVIDNNGDNEQTVATTNLDSLFCSLDWAPDGDSLVYSFKRHDEDREYWYLAEIPASGGVETRIGEPSDLAILTEKWLSDKSGLIVNAIDETTHQPQLYAVSYPDGARRRITVNQSSLAGFSMTADGRLIIMPQIISNRQIWNLGDGTAESAMQLLNGTERHFDTISWAKNDYLVFDEDENSSFDNFNIYRMRPDGTGLQQLTFGSGNNTQPEVSPNGTSIVFVSNRSGKSQLWRMNSEGRDLVQLTDLANDVIRPDFSPDGQTVFFSVSVAGKCNIWEISTGGGDPSPVIYADVYLWAVSPDGIRLAYSTFDKQAKTIQTRIHSLKQNRTELVLDISPETWMEWSNDGKAIFFNTARDETQNVWIQNLDRSKPRPITAFDSEKVFRFGWSPNGKSLACIRHTVTFDAVELRFDQVQ